jgi:membrane-bound ClpP family serine protease
MKIKIINLAWLGLLAFLGVFGFVTQIIILTSSEGPQPSTSEFWTSLAFLILFVLVFASCAVFFVIRLIRLIVDIRINRENK